MSSSFPSTRSFALRSDSFAEGEPLPLAQRSGLFGVDGGLDRSPRLSWSGAPPLTRSFAVSAFDPDAPTGSGFWHWFVLDLPAETDEIAEDAGRAGSDLPADARHLENDAGFRGFVGAAPPTGHGMHRYIFTVIALDVARLDVPDTASPALASFALRAHTLARADLVATAVG